MNLGFIGKTEVPIQYMTREINETRLVKRRLSPSSVDDTHRRLPAFLSHEVIAGWHLVQLTDHLDSCVQCEPFSHQWNCLHINSPLTIHINEFYNRLQPAHKYV